DQKVKRKPALKKPAQSHEKIPKVDVFLLAGEEQMDAREEALSKKKDPDADGEEPNLSQASTLVLPGVPGAVLPEYPQKDDEKPLLEEPEPEPVKEAFKEEDKKDKEPEKLRRLTVSLEFEV
ncbi:unnamed protein product, partial [Symbiodinium sp. CCMP2592]